MIRSFARVVTLGIAACGAMLAAQSVSATAYTYDFTNQGNLTAGSGSSLCFNCTPASPLTLNVYGAHLNDTKVSNNYTVSGATVGVYSGGGIGVSFGNDTPFDGTHQLDNYGGGTDFVVLQFSQNVTINSIGRNVYPLANIRPSDDDASFEAYAGSLSSITGGLDKSLFKDLAGDGQSGDTLTGSAASSSIWLVAAYVNSTSHDDGFKISNLKVSTPNSPGAVPEPATWALMIVGMGAIGSTMRRRKSQGLDGYIA